MQYDGRSTGLRWLQKECSKKSKPESLITADSQYSLIENTVIMKKGLINAFSVAY